jgi:nucleotide-binding universal stress UspA family protein
MSDSRDGGGDRGVYPMAAQVIESAATVGFNMPSNVDVLRLLVPIDATPKSHWGIQYALRKHRGGQKIDVSLLHVAEPLLRAWDTLRFYTEQEIAAFRARRAQWLLEDAAAWLRNHRINHCLYLREGDVAFEILDAAEQLGCSEIVMPAPPKGWRRAFCGNVVSGLVREQRTVAVVTVNAQGLPQPN